MQCKSHGKREIEEAFAAAADKRKQELLVEDEAITVAKKTRLQMQQECGKA